ncbi:hypothetical protein [Delftia acidovorans]
MRERPILFSGPMVRALLAGTKTQTRRVVKPQPNSTHSGFPYWNVGGYRASWCRSAADGGPLEPANPLLCRYGQRGDRLWVRETFGHFERNENFKLGCEVFYRADGNCLELEPWRPSIHMPRWASRITLDINALRIERLHDISEADAAAEGVFYSTDHMGHWSGTGDRWWTTAREAFRDLWISINGQPSWDANPWVWALKFDRIQATEKGKKQ